MLLNDDEIAERVESPLNLLNRLRTSLNKTSYTDTRRSPLSTPIHPALPPKSEDIIEDLEDKINNTAARSKAMGIMLSAMDELKAKLPDVQRPEKLASIASEMSKIISQQFKKEEDRNHLSQIIVYAPQVQNIENYEVVDVNE